MQMLEFGLRLGAQSFEPILQEKHPHQIARGGRAHQLAD
jgi:hypothetical protein